MLILLVLWGLQDILVALKFFLRFSLLCCHIELSGISLNNMNDLFLLIMIVLGFYNNKQLINKEILIQ